MTRHLRRTAALAFIATALAAPLTTSLAQSFDASRPNKVVFQVSENDPKTWNLALNNAKNVQQALGSDQTAVEIVVYGPGIGMLKMDSPVAERIAEATGRGVAVVACENTMKAQKLSRADMLQTVGYVPAGVVELMTRQKEGFAYVRP